MNLKMRFLWYYQPISVGSYCYDTDGSLYSLPLAGGTEEAECFFEVCGITGGNLTCVCMY